MDEHVQGMFEVVLTMFTEIVPFDIEHDQRIELLVPVNYP